MGVSIQIWRGPPPSLFNHWATLPSPEHSSRGEEILGPEKATQNGGRKIPAGPIKCLINSRRRIGGNNEHLSGPFIAYKTLLPAFSHLIFTTGLGGRYYHYLYFIGEESKAPTPPSSARQAASLGVGVDRGALVGTCFSSPAGCHNLSLNCH